MYNVSSKYLAASTSTIRDVSLRGVIRGYLGGEIEINEEDIISGSFSITDKAVNSDKFNIGSVYVGSCSFTLKRNKEWGSLNRAEVEFIFSILVDKDNNEWEDVKLGKFDIPFSGITKMKNTIGVVANSRMSRFDKKFSAASNISGSSYDLLQYCCTMCNMSLGNTEEEIKSFANGNLLLSITPDMNFNSFRDIIMWVASLNACFATIDRNGDLVLREFSQFNSSGSYILNKDTIEKSTYYDGVMDIDNITMNVGDTTYQYDESASIYNTLNLETNPFLTNSDMDDLQISTSILNIGNVVCNLDYHPFNIDYNGDPCLDLGDMIAFSDDGDIGFAYYITGYTWKFRGVSNLQGVPYSNEDSIIQSASSPGDGGGSSESSNSFLTFLGTGELNIRNNAKEVLAFKAYVSLLANMPCAAAVTMVGNIITEGNIIFNVYYDGVKILTLPKYYLDHLGYETFSFTLGFDATENFEVHQVLIKVLSSGGEFDVAAYDSQLVLMASGIKSASPSWTGVYEIEETMPRIPLSDLVKFRELKENLQVIVDNPKSPSQAESLARITLNQLLKFRHISDEVIYEAYKRYTKFTVYSSDATLSGSAQLIEDSDTHTGYAISNLGSYPDNIASFVVNIEEANTYELVVSTKNSGTITTQVDGVIIQTSQSFTSSVYDEKLIDAKVSLGVGTHYIVLSTSDSAPLINYIRLYLTEKTVFDNLYSISTSSSAFAIEYDSNYVDNTNTFKLKQKTIETAGVNSTIDSGYLNTVTIPSDEFSNLDEVVINFELH